MRSLPRAFVGLQLRRLRTQRGLTQAELARRLQLSPSYLNQLERNQRPLTMSVLLRVNEVLGIDLHLLSDAAEARLMGELEEALRAADLDAAVDRTALSELVAAMPEMGQAIVGLHRRLRAARTRLEEEGGTDAERPSGLAYEEVRDLFYDHRNHFAALDALAESLGAGEPELQADPAERVRTLLENRHGVRVVLSDGDGLAAGEDRRYERAARLLRLRRGLGAGPRAFQMATQLAFLEAGQLLDEIAESSASLTSDEARALARIGLAHYFAGAVVMPYREFLAAAEGCGYDIDLLGDRFGMSFESVCHRLSTLQRPEAQGVPFIFIRVDRAGNISKRQSATDFHFSRSGGSCPLWTVHEAFTTPGRILRQIAQMPDGRTYLWVARTVTHRTGGFAGPQKLFAVALGCDLRHASQLVYSRGLPLEDPAAAVPIGGGCRICDRPACPQRAFPALGRPLAVDEDRRSFAPYRARESATPWNGDGDGP